MSRLPQQSAEILWRSDDGSTIVTIPANVVDGIAGYVFQAYKSIPRRGAEAGGVLLGSVRIGRVTEIFISGFEPVPCDYIYGPSFTLSDAGQAEFRAVMTRHATAEILGYYRSHTRAGFGLESSDRELTAHLFPGFSGLVLLIKPTSAVNLTGTYYFFQRGNLEMRPVGREFPFAGNIPGGAPAPDTFEMAPEPPQPVQESLELDASPEAPESVEIAEPPKQRKGLQWANVAAGFMIAIALALLWWQWWGDSAGRDTARSAIGRVASLGLNVQPGEGGWRITWDPNSPAAMDATSGALNVSEVDSHERIPLDTTQIRAGAVTYRPGGDDVAFRLDLVRSDNTLSSETYRVLLRPEEETATAPHPPPAQVVKKSAMPPAEKVGKAPEPVAEKSPEKAPEKADAPHGAGYVEPEVLSRVAPEVPEGIRPRITAPQPIDVKVSISSDGRVTSAIPIQHGEGLINYLAQRAVAAAREWTFTPAQQDGKPVPSTRTIHFVFEQ